MSEATPLKFNPPPGWPTPPDGWVPPKGWTPDPAWPAPPPGWELWVEADVSAQAALPEGERSESTAVSDGFASSADHRVAFLEAEVRALRSRLAEFEGTHEVPLDDERILQEVGIYRYHHPLEDAAAYKERLTEISGHIAELVKTRRAIEKSDLFTFDNSLAKGRRMTRDLSKLMLRAYNAEADNALRTLRAGNVHTARRRIEASRAAIARLGRMMGMHISDAFHELRVEEIELTADFLMKKQEEREARREERARLREERKVEAELRAERECLDKERTHITQAIESLRVQGREDPDLLRRLDEIDGAIAHNDLRAANVRAGYVYVVSNRGAFGTGVVKIGLTRRLKPLERITELSGASVPFRFDIHALFFSEDAVTLEANLHEHFSDRRLNQVNGRKEFFFATPSEVREALLSRVGNLLEFHEAADATEYLQSISAWPQERRR